MRLLVSCCDNGTGLFLWEGGEYKHLYLGHTMSIVRCPWGIAVMSEEGIKVYDEDTLKVIHSVPFQLPGHHGSDYDPNSDMLVVASSDRNSLNWVDIDSGKIVEELQVNPNGSHTNDIFIHKDEIYVSSFNEGIIKYDRLTKERIKLFDANKPHSVKLRNDHVWWCNSESREVKKDGQTMCIHPGFVRGIDWDTKGNLVVGVSHHKYRREGSAGVYLNSEFYGIPHVNRTEVNNVYSILVLP